MPRRRHHLHLKRYRDCFTGAEAIDWLINNVDCVGLLKDGGQLSRQQAVKILELCFKFDVIEDVRGSDGTMISFRGDRKHLYRFVTERPSLFGDVITCSTTGVRSMTRVSSAGSASKTPTGRKRKRALEEVDINQMNRKSTSALTQSDITKIWQEHIIAR